MNWINTKNRHLTMSSCTQILLKQHSLWLSSATGHLSISYTRQEQQQHQQWQWAQVLVALLMATHAGTRPARVQRLWRPIGQHRKRFTSVDCSIIVSASIGRQITDRNHFSKTRNAVDLSFRTRGLQRSIRRRADPYPRWTDWPLHAAPHAAPVC